MKTIKLGIHGIVVEFNAKTKFGTIVSDLKNSEDIDMDGDVSEFEAAIDGLESVILAHAIAGVDIESTAYKSGIETAIEAISNQFL